TVTDPRGRPPSPRHPPQPEDEVSAVRPRAAHDTIHGLTTGTPVRAKSMVFRVAQVALWNRHIAAIGASAMLIGCPACSRLPRTSTYPAAAGWSKASKERVSRYGRTARSISTLRSV